MTGNILSVLWDIWNTFYERGASADYNSNNNNKNNNNTIFSKSRGHLKILRCWIVTWSKFQTEGPRILGAKVRNVVARETWHPVFVHSWIKYSHTDQ